MNQGMFNDLVNSAQTQIELLKRIALAQEAILAQIQQSVIAIATTFPTGDEPGPVEKSPKATTPKAKAKGVA
jgi:hypothetical protein